MPALIQTAWMRSRPFECLEHARRRYGTRFWLKALAYPPLVFLADPSDAAAVFSASPHVLAPGEGGRTIEPIVGRTSFMLADGEAHRQARARLASPFTAESITHHGETIRDIAEREIATWPTGVPVALHPRLRKLSLRVILHTLFGADVVERAPDLHARLLAMLDVAAGPMLSLPAARRVPVVSAQWRRFLKEREAVDAVLYRLIRDRLDEPPRGGDVLGVLLTRFQAERSPISIESVRDSLMSLVLAGHETTAAESAWTFQLLAHDRRVQRVLADELDAGGDDYLLATMQEALRHRPVFLFAIPRAVRQPVEIGQWTFPSSVHLLVCLYLIQHDPALWSDPRRFLPERFLGSDPPGRAWLPWGGGRRRCLGWRLALLEMQLVVASALRRYVFEPGTARPERPRWRSVIVTPHAGCRVVLRQRRA